jgi:hypothetical protein
MNLFVYYFRNQTWKSLADFINNEDNNDDKYDDDDDDGRSSYFLNKKKKHFKKNLKKNPAKEGIIKKRKNLTVSYLI